MREKIKRMTVRALVGVLRTCDAGDEFAGMARADVFEAVLQELERREAKSGKALATHVVTVMNGLLEAAPDAISALVEHRVPSTQELGDHPTCQVGPGPEFQVGMMGVLNAIGGSRPDGWGYIAASVEDGGLVEKFVVLGDDWPADGADGRG